MTDPVLFSEITDGCPSGDGVFDQLMKSFKSHLMEEFDNNRIRGSEYTQVYLQSTQSAMSMAIQWQLSAQNAANQAALVEVQIANAEKQTLLLEQQRQLLIAQTEQAIIQTEGIVAANLNIPKQGDVLDAQEEQLLKQNELTTAQILNSEYQTDNTLPAQVAILEQKLITEEAQTKDITVQGTVAGVLGNQNALYTSQSEGYVRDAEQKASRILSDVWGIAVSADVDGDSIPTQISKTQMDEMLSELKSNAGLA